VYFIIFNYSFSALTLLGNRKGRASVWKILLQKFPKVLLWETLGIRPILGLCVEI